jgi:hypothetical protein
VTTVKKVKREVRDYEQARMTPEKVKVWEFAPDCAYEITKYWGDSRVYHGCVKPPNRWQKDKTGNYNYRPGEGMKFDYFRWNANFDLWEQDEEFVKIMRETVGIEVQQKSLYYDYLGAKTPRKGDNSYIAR